MPTAEKERKVKELEERFKEAQALVFTDFRGLSANEMVALRQKLKNQGLEYRVVKNRLARRAAEGVGLTLDSDLEGPTGICFGYHDPVRAFKESVAVSKEYPHYVIKGGVSEGHFLDADGAKGLAQLPAREELLAQLAGSFQGPIRHLALVLNEIIRQLVSVVDEVAKVKPDVAPQEATAQSEDGKRVERAESQAEPTAAPEGAETPQAEVDMQIAAGGDSSASESEDETEEEKGAS